MGIGNWFTNKKQKTVDAGKKNINYEQVQGTASEIKDMAKIILSPKDIIRNAKTETFQEAKARLGVTDLDLSQTYKNFALICYVSLLFTCLCLFGAFYYLIAMKSIAAGLAMLSVMLFCLANAFKFSFRALQIKHQKLFSIKDWWNRASEWIPKINTNGVSDNGRTTKRLGK